MEFFSQRYKGKSPLPPFSKGGMQRLNASWIARFIGALSLGHFPLWKKGDRGGLSMLTYRPNLNPISNLRHRWFRRTQSLPTSLFQREEPLSMYAILFNGHFPLWKRGIEGDCRC